MACRRTPRLPDGTRVVDAISVGVLAKTYPLSKIQAVLQATGKSSQRQRALPAQVTLYYVLALSLCMHMASQEVLRWLLQGIRWLLHPAAYAAASKSAITQARQRLGWEPLQRLYAAVVKPIAQAATRGAWYRRWRLVSLDGSTLEVADTPDNERAWGRPSASRGTAAYPRLRFVSLLENGTHVLFAAELGDYHSAEVKLAQEVVKALQPGMLCLADREFLGYKLWGGARERGADLLWRAKKNLRLPCVQRLADGSYLSELYASEKERRQQRNAVRVRVIEYRLQGVANGEPFYRLITTILEPESAPAQELAALYHERWEIETTLSEFKVRLPGARLLLRSKTPDLVRQEFYGFLLTHFAIRGLMHEAALAADEDPDRVSFLHAVRVVRRHLRDFVISPQRRTRRVASGRVARNPGGAGQQQSRPSDPAWSQTQDEQLCAASAWSVPDHETGHRSVHSNP